MNYAEILAHPAVKGAIAGALAAATVDRQAFTRWQSFDDARRYSWNLAIWRWLQGAVIGACAAVGMP